MKFKLYSWKKHLKFKIIGILFQFCYFYISLKIRLTNFIMVQILRHILTILSNHSINE